MAKRRVIPKHLKPQRGLGSEVLQERRRQGRAIRKERDARARREAEDARRRMRLSHKSEEKESKNWINALMNSVASDQQAFAKSMGINTSILTGTWYSSTLHAYTDWESIVVRYPLGLAPDRSDRNANLDTIIDIRGILQHELGHIRFTVPYQVLREQYSDPHRLALYEEKHHLQQMWNMLEDQRMESKVVQEVPRIANYFTVTIGKHISNNAQPSSATWLLLAGREYLADSIRSKSAEEFNQIVSPTIDMPDPAKSWYDIVSEYKSATTVDEMMEALYKAADFHAWHVPKTASVPSSSEHRGWYKKTETGDTSHEGKIKESAVDKGQSDSYPGGAGSHDDKSDDKSDDSSQTQDGGKSEMEQIVDQIMDELRNSQDNVNSLASANATVNGAGSMGTAPQTGMDMSPDEIAQAMAISVGVERALVDFETQSQPGWISRTDSGVIDALAYRTKPAGSRDYHRRMEGEYNAGIDLHVSMLCDISGSMSGEPMKQLSIAMYGFGLACSNLGISANYVLWSTMDHEGEVWPDGVPQPKKWEAGGGTNPTSALDSLDEHNERGASNHLVYIFTDGDWDASALPLTNWQTPGRFMVVNVLGTLSTSRPYFAGADHIANISDVSQIPDSLTEAVRYIMT